MNKEQSYQVIIDLVAKENIKIEKEPKFKSLLTTKREGDLVTIYAVKEMVAGGWFYLENIFDLKFGGEITGYGNPLGVAFIEIDLNKIRSLEHYTKLSSNSLYLKEWQFSEEEKGTYVRIKKNYDDVLEKINVEGIKYDELTEHEEGYHLFLHNVIIQ